LFFGSLFWPCTPILKKSLAPSLAPGGKTGPIPALKLTPYMSKWAKIKTSLVKFLKEMRRINYPQAQPPVETIKLGCGNIAME
jgi:hypothetical protein